MINFDEFDIEERTRDILDYIFKIEHTDSYSYNGYRYFLVNDNDYAYDGSGQWTKLGSIKDEIFRISDDEKDLIRKDKILITTLFLDNSTWFMSWTLSELKKELKRYSPNFPR